MLTIEYKVNGTLIGQIYAHNKGYVDAGSDVCNYDWHCYSMSLRGVGTIVSGDTTHSRAEGFEVLAAKLFTEADRLLKEG